jgi:hypothetical protein
MRPPCSPAKENPVQTTGLASVQVLLLLLGVGGTANDLVSMIDAQMYFESRGVEKSVDKMLELAQKSGGGKAQIMQLLAIRRLGEDFPEVAKAHKTRVLQALTPIAKGEKAQDPHGFAREYAIRTLRGLGANLALPAQKMDRLLTRDLLGWFPGDVKVVGAGYVASAAEANRKMETNFRRLVKALIPQQEYAQLFDFADRVGNVRVDGVGFAFFEGGKENQDKTRIYVHLQGKGDAKLFAAFLAEVLPNGRLETEKDAKGGSIRIVTAPNSPPALAFLGDTDLIMAGYGDHRQNHLDVLRQVLKVRAEGKGSVLTGPLADELKKVDPRAIGVVVGELSPVMQNEFRRGLGVPLPAPTRVHLQMDRNGGGIDVKLAGSYEDEDKAKEFAAGLTKVNKQAIEALEKLPKEKLPADVNKLLQTSLTSFRIDTKGKTVTLLAQVPADLLKVLPDLLFRTMPQGGPPVPKLEKKGGEARLWLTRPPALIPCLHETRPAA